MDKAAGLCIPEIGTTVQSMWALLSATYLSSPLHSETRNTILQFLYSASVPLGRAALVSSVFSLSTLLFFISFSTLLFSSLFLTLKDPTFSVSLWSHTTDEMTHGGKDREAFCCIAWNWIPMTSSARCNTSHSSVAARGWRSITPDGFYTVTSLSSGDQMKSLFHYIARLIHKNRSYDYL